MIKLDYIPSWIDGATTLLSKLNKCIEKIESLSTTSNNALEVANNALSLAQTNEHDIGTNDGEISQLNQQMQRTLKLPVNSPSEEEVVTILPNNGQGSKPISQLGGKAYRHNINMVFNQGRIVQLFCSVVTNRQAQFTSSEFINEILYKFPTGRIIGFITGDTSQIETCIIEPVSGSNISIDVYNLNGVLRESFTENEAFDDNVIEA